MTPDAFRAAGEALYGSRWIAEMARALSCSTRSVRRWSAGSWPVPMGVEHDVELLLAARRATLEVMLRDEYGFPVGSPDSPRAQQVPVKPPRWMIDEERAKLERERE